VEVQVGVYPEKEVLRVEGFKKEAVLDGDGLPVYVHEDTYKYLPEKVYVDYAGKWYKEYVSPIIPRSTLEEPVKRGVK